MNVSLHGHSGVRALVEIRICLAQAEYMCTVKFVCVCVYIFISLKIWIKYQYTKITLKNTFPPILLVVLLCNSDFVICVQMFYATHKSTSEMEFSLWCSKLHLKPKKILKIHQELETYPKINWYWLAHWLYHSQPQAHLTDFGRFSYSKQGHDRLSIVAVPK